MLIRSYIRNILLRYKQFMKSNDVRFEQIRYLNVKNILIERALNSTLPGTSSLPYINGQQIIVSLTTYGKRLQEVFLTIESIMQQTIKPNKIILWLSDEQKGEKLPFILQKQINRGLQVKYCKDIRSYTKLIPTLRQYPKDAIITIDDDVIYRFDMIENLVNAYLSNPHYIYCNRMHRIRMAGKGLSVTSYNKWEWEVDDDRITSLNFPTGCGGVLYPPHSLSPEVFNEKIFTKICPLADDIWFKAMALLNNYQSQKVTTQEDTIIFSEDNQDIGLSQVNVIKSANDKQFKAVFDYYQLYNKLKE